MNARKILGRKIARVLQARVRTEAGDYVHNLQAIELDDGSRIEFDTVPMPSDGEYTDAIVATHVRAQPWCGHSACRQNWIDTGATTCIVAPAAPEQA